MDADTCVMHAHIAIYLVSKKIDIGKFDLLSDFSWYLVQIFASDSFLELTEYTREEILGRNCRYDTLLCLYSIFAFTSWSDIQFYPLHVYSFELFPPFSLLLVPLCWPDLMHCLSSCLFGRVV